MTDMAHQVIWTKLILETFIEEGNLTKEEEAIMRTRAAGWTITKQALELHMSTAKVNRIIRALKRKYDEAQKTSLILPKRKSSAEELYMDTH